MIMSFKAKFMVIDSIKITLKISREARCIGYIDKIYTKQMSHMFEIAL